MSHRIRKLYGLKVRHYAAHLVDLNEYWAGRPGSNISEKICVTEINYFLNSMPNSCINQAYVQGSGCEYITIKEAVNVFEQMEISEYIY